MSFAAVGAAVGGSLVSGLFNRRSNRAATNAANAQTDAANRQSAIAEDQWADWKQTFKPLQARLVADADKIDSPEAYARAGENAHGDVTQAFEAQRQGLTQRLNSMGVDPSSGRYATTLSRMGLAEAAASAGAQNKARSDVTDKGRAYRMDVYGLGKGLPAQASAGFANAGNAQAGVANYNANLASRNSAGIGAMFQSAMPGLSRAFSGWGGSTPGGNGAGGDLRNTWDS